MTARPRLGAPAVALAIAAGIAACGSPATTPTPSPTHSVAVAAPWFRLEMKAPAYQTFVASTNPATSSCVTPKTGPWSFLYTAAASGSSDFLSLNLTLLQGAATPAGSNDFRLSINDREFIDELGRVSGSQGSSGKVTVALDDLAAHITIEGTAARPGTNTDLTPVTLDLTCPLAS